MANVLINESSMTAIANAIRTKKGVTTKYKPADMADAISSITTGGITPTGTKSITANGTYDVTDFASAEVNVPTSGTTPTGTKEISITANGTTTEDVTNYANAQITVNVEGGGGISVADILNGVEPSGVVNFTATKTITGRSISGRVNMTGLTIDLSVGNYGINGYAISDNSSLTTLTLINSKTSTLRTTYGAYGISSNSKLATIVIKGKIPGIDQSGFRNNAKLAVFDLETISGSIGNNCFNGDSSLKTVVLRNDSVVTITSSTFTGSAVAGANGAVVYVPSALVESYKTASVWATLFNNGYITFSAIEGSIYETQYADGTPISA